jgi:hypothetical protein
MERFTSLQTVNALIVGIRLDTGATVGTLCPAFQLGDAALLVFELLLLPPTETTQKEAGDKEEQGEVISPLPPGWDD